MADIKKLIYKLKTVGELTDNLTIEISDLELLDDAADALTELQDENKKLRDELEQVKEENKVYRTQCQRCQFYPGELEWVEQKRG